MPAITSVLLKMQIPAMSLKQFMLRSEVLKLYRGFLRLGRLMETPPESQTSSGICGSQHKASNARNLHPIQQEWNEWVRAEFRLRQGTADEEAVRMMLAHGKRQLQEMERTILLAMNRNSDATVSNNNSTISPVSNNLAPSCKTAKK